MTDDDSDGARGDLAEAASRYLGIDVDRYPKRRRERLAETWRAGDGDPREALRAALCVGETMFLRHAEHFEALQGIVAGLPGYGREGVRAWSAGCATGEEAYTLAATLRATCGEQLRVIGSDVRKDFLSHAGKGRYGPWSLRGVDLESHATWLRPDGAGAQVEDGVRRLVNFQELNLKRGLYPADLDVIFCRNVLLYFTEADARQVFEDMAESMRPGGVLFIGYQDPRPTSEEGWEPERLGDVEFYRRPLPADAATDPPGLRSASRTSAPPSLAGSPSRPPATSIPPSSSAPTSRAGPSAHPAPPRLPPGADDSTEPRVSPARGPLPPDLEAGLEEARARAGSGDVTGALEHLEQLMEAHPDSVAPCVLAALLAEEAGDAQLVVRYSRRACFLAPDAIVPNLMMGFGLDALDQGDKARRYYRRAADGVKRVGDHAGALPDGEGLTARQVERMLDGRDD